MLDPRIYRAALVPVLLAVIVCAFSLQDQPGPRTTTLAPDAFSGARAERQLADLARAAARPAEPTWWQRLRAWFDGLVVARPNLASAQSLAALMLVLVAWQVLGWLNTFTPMVGDVPYAVELVASSPAAAYLSGLQSFDLQSLLMWAGVGFVGWLVSESGPLGSSRVVG
jgi:hypothetical protein